ncbi:MAG: hypothetical protein WC329_05145 [Candidatus Omnitrophota bacterium]|jgi:hypothetical protein
MSNEIGPDGGFEMDWSDFDSKFFKWALENAPAAAEQGMFEALSEFKNDCDNVVPKTPHLEGNLRGDYSLVLEGITQSKVTNHSGGKGTNHGGTEKPAERRGALNILGKLIFRMPYAAKWHEAIDKEWSQGGVLWSEPGVGPKFAEKKLMMFGKKYFQIIASRVRETTEK